MIKGIIKRIVMTLKKEKKVPVVKLVSESNIMSDKTVLITGGSGGIGKAIAKGVVAGGGKVIISGSNEDKLIKIRDEIGSEDKVKCLKIDFNHVELFDKKIEEAIKLFPEKKIDILVNCSGVIDHNDFFNVSEEIYDRVLNVNLKGTFFMCQAVGKYMVKNKIKGHILNLSSSSALRPASTPYNISKWGIRGFTKGLADVMAPYGITVNAIGPGPTATEMLGVSETDTIYHPTNPSGRYATPEEIANLALFMISGAGDMIVGDTFYITGGSGTTTMHK